MTILTPELASAILDHLGPPRRLQTRRDDIPIPSPGESITVTLPEAPSANVYWRRAGLRIHVSAEAKAYKEAVGMLTAKSRTNGQCAFPSGDLSVTVLWHRSAKRGDLDNRVKILLDALAGTLFRNDKQIATIHAQRVDQHASLQRGFMRVTLERV